MTKGIMEGKITPDKARCPLKFIGLGGWEEAYCEERQCAWWVDYEGDNWSKEGCGLRIIAESVVDEK